MTKIVYDVRIVIDRNAANSDPKNQAPLGELSLDGEPAKGGQVNMYFKKDDEILGIMHYVVVDIIKTPEADKIILLLIGRSD